MADNISEPPKSNEQAIYLKSAANISLTEYRVEKNDRNRLHFMTGAGLRLGPINYNYFKKSQGGCLK